MHGIMYEVAQQRIDDQRRAAAKDGEARVSRAAAKARRARKAAVEPIATPAIPDYPHELFAAVPEPRRESGQPEAGRGRHARAGR